MRILAIFAHPDDESYGPGGTLARATRNGHIVSLLTFTHGESGSLGISKELSAPELARRRNQELKCAASQLGIQQLQLHDLPDKHLQDIPEETGIDLINKEITRFKPDIIITYHDNTISGHTDHLAVTNWTFNTVKSIQHPPKLYFFGLDQKQTSMLKSHNLIPVLNSEVTHRIYVEQFIKDKIAAIQCHYTQITLWRKFVAEGVDFNALSKWEVFVQKWPKPENRRIKHDLFE
jgi:LmbE family N-acetylglucosaminyl deacetylase